MTMMKLVLIASAMIQPMALGLAAVSRTENDPENRCLSDPVIVEGDRPGRGICLNMIVKDESHVLPRLLASVRDYVDYYVISDTGSSDGTPGVIRSVMSDYSIDGEVHHDEWVNFGTNRDRALRHAYASAKCNWVLIIDADEELKVFNPSIFDALKVGTTYTLGRKLDSIYIFNLHLVDIRHTIWKWEGPAHEYLTRVTGDHETDKLSIEDLQIVTHQSESASNLDYSSEEKYLRYASYLEEDLRENPGNHRSQYYLAQSYRDAGHLKRAQREFQKRVDMGGWIEEHFVAQMHLGNIAWSLDEDEGIVVKEYLTAYALIPERRMEPLWRLSSYYRGTVKEDNYAAYAKAYLFAKAGADLSLKHIKIPQGLFVPYIVYEWKALDELCIVAWYVGQFEEGRRACQEVLRRAENVESIDVPESDVERIRNNLQHYLDHAEHLNN